MLDREALPFAKEVFFAVMTDGAAVSAFAGNSSRVPYQRSQKDCQNGQVKHHDTGE